MSDLGDDIDGFITIIEGAPLKGRYWSSFVILALGSILDFFDFFVVAFLVAVLGPRWHLTYGQSAVMLLSAGVGSIVGALVAGAMADVIGRRPVIAGCLFFCGFSGACIAFLPEGAWWAFAVMRSGVGFGLAGASAVSLALIVEYTPTRLRTVLASISVTFSTAGTFLASGASASLMNVLGWRGLAALSASPAIVGMLVLAVVPESVRWLVSVGRIGQARAVAAKLLHCSVDSLPDPKARPSANRKPIAFGEMLNDPRKLFLTITMGLCFGTTVIGVYLWGPTITSLVLHVPVARAAMYFAFVSGFGFSGKILFSLLAQRIGRRRCIEICGYGQALLLAGAAFYADRIVLGIPVFIVLLSFGALFFDGAFANIGPYTSEMFPVRLAARGVGLFQSANGMGKILGPLSLALIAGAHNYVTPQATSAAVRPAFLFLSACAVLAAIAVSVVRVETHGQPLSLGTEESGQAHS